jgi:hypothetical protein
VARRGGAGVSARSPLLCRVGEVLMLVRNRDDVEVVTYAGDAQGVEMRPLITAREGAPHFAMRVVKLGWTYTLPLPRMGA